MAGQAEIAVRQVCETKGYEMMNSPRLLDPDELAELFKMKRRTVISSIAKQQGFPSSVTGTQKPRWLESEVVRFLKRKSAQNAQNA
jgi:predicted DNA-binding transcriptional regulator AlpA